MNPAVKNATKERLLLNMNKKVKLSLIIGIPVLAVIAAALILFLPGGVLNKAADSDPASNTSITTPEGKPAITVEKFNQVQKGMTYEEVKTLLGADGEKVVNEGAQSTDSEYLTTYRWYGQNDGSVAVMSFLDGKLAAKTQIGLS
jgi:hypothetical protein